MTDNTRKRGKADRIRIAVSQPHELRRWSKALGITPGRLKNIVAITGPMLEDVQAFLIDQIRESAPESPASPSGSAPNSQA